MKDTEYLPTGEIKYKGTVYPGFRKQEEKVTFNVMKWVKHWEDQIKIIRLLKLDIYQINDIYDHFKTDLLLYAGTKQMREKHQEISQISNELKIAFHQAFSNYRDSRKGFWSFVAGLFAGKIIDKLDIEDIIFPR